jgi:hypothetical protein
MTQLRTGIFTPSQDDDLEEHVGSGHGGPLASPKEVPARVEASAAPVALSEPDAYDQKAAAPAAPATDLTGARLALEAAQRTYEETAAEVQTLGAQVRLAETALQNAQRDLIAHEPRTTPRQLAADFARSEMERRAAQRDGTVPTPAPIVPGPSPLDRSRMRYFPGGDGQGFVAKQMKFGASRGAFGAHMQGVQLPKEPAA